MSDAIPITPFDIILCAADSVDMVSPALAGHHLRGAYIASRLAEELGLPQAQRDEITLAAALRDIGALSVKEKLSVLRFDATDLHVHANVGFRLISKFPPFAKAASYVRYHHTYWSNGEGLKSRGEPVPIEAHLLHLADRLDTLLDKRKEVLGQVGPTCDTIRGRSGAMFVPEHVDALMKLAGQESFWLDIVSPWVQRILVERTNFADFQMDSEKLMGIADMIRQMIDFRSRYTSMHSAGVAATAEALAGFLRFSREDCRTMRVAGFLHDLGKLAVPIEVLEKPGDLTTEETNVLRHHTYYGFRAMQRVPYLATINSWATLHHERLDGQGYPFHLTGADLSLGSRIMAVADVFAALTENRPYRQGMVPLRARSLMQNLAAESALDAQVVAAFLENEEIITSERLSAHDASRKEYEEFWATHTGMR